MRAADPTFVQLLGKFAVNTMKDFLRIVAEGFLATAAFAVLLVAVFPAAEPRWTLLNVLFSSLFFGFVVNANRLKK